MKNIRYAVLGAALLFISSAPLAFATVSIDLTSPTDPQPFGVFCNPYTTPFTGGSYYIPNEGGACSYSLPLMSGGFHILQVYKGVPGNATLVDDDNTTLPNTVLITSPNSFNGSQGDDFFSVAYGVNSQADLTGTENYLETGSLLPANVTVNMVQWKWGVKPTSPLTVTADNKTMLQGAALPAFTATLSGFVAPDTASSSDVTGQAACTTTATAASPAGSYPITCTVGSLASASNYTFGTFVPGTLTITAVTPPPTDHTAPTIVITSPVKDGLYAKTDTTVHVTATVTDQSPIADTTYWFNGVKINPANALPLSNAPVVSKVSVASKDIYGNAATSTVTIYVVKSVNSCLLDIIAVLTAITQDKTLPDKPTILNLIADCTALLKGKHHY